MKEISVRQLFCSNQDELRILGGLFENTLRDLATFARFVMESTMRANFVLKFSDGTDFTNILMMYDQSRRKVWKSKGPAIGRINPVFFW